MLLAQLQQQPVRPPFLPPQEPGTLNPEPGTPPQAVPDIRDIIPPEPLPDYVQLALIVILAALSVAMLAVLIAWYLKQRRLARNQPAPPISPFERARRELEKLRANPLSLSPNELGLRTSNIVKRYFYERYHDPVLYETSEEFAKRDNVVKPIPTSKRAALTDFLERCDAVKYSRFPEAASRAQPLIDEAFAIVDEPHAFTPALSSSVPAADAELSQ